MKLVFKVFGKIWDLFLMESLRFLLWLCGKSFVLAIGCNLKIFYFEVEFVES